MEIVGHPPALLEILATTMPEVTHFYLCWMVMQWTTHALNLTRYIQMIKFLGLRAIYELEDARKGAEPEDQEYYGIGARSARAAVEIAVAIIFITLSPLITILGFIVAAISRVIYGYFLTCAETKKPDLGGALWVTQLEHLHCALLIYCLLMLGVMNARSKDVGPIIIVAVALVGVLERFHNFKHKFQWETLPFEEVLTLDTAVSKPLEPLRSFEQPELQELSTSTTAVLKDVDDERTDSDPELDVAAHDDSIPARAVGESQKS